MKPDEIRNLLPWVMQQATEQHGGYAALLEVMAALHEPAEETLREIHAFFEPAKTPARFLPYLAGWLDYDWAPDDSADDLTRRGRRLMEQYLPLTRSRGTVHGLKQFLRIAVGVDGIEIEEDAARHHVTVCVPTVDKATEAAIRRIVEREKPAHLTFELSVEDMSDATDICDNESTDAA